MKKIKNKYIYHNRYYVTSETCIEILEQGKSKTCKRVFIKWVISNLTFAQFATLINFEVNNTIDLLA
jgi:hypothetical protein